MTRGDHPDDIDAVYPAPPPTTAEWFRAGGQFVPVDGSVAWADGPNNNGESSTSSAAKPPRASRSRSRAMVLGGNTAASQRRKTYATDMSCRSLRVSRVSRVLGPSSSTSLSLRRSDQVTVFVHVVFLKIGEIDTVKEKYAADVFIQARWREPLFDEYIDLKPEEITWSKYWNPQLYVDNVAGDPKETIWRTVMWKNRKEAFVFERRRVAGMFLENYNLFQFPFDTQDLTLSLVSERSARELTLVEDSGELSTVNVQSFVNEQEWRLYNNVETEQETVTRIYQDDESTHPSFTAICHASRRYGFYFWNIIFVMFFICSMTYSTFAVDIRKTENRLQLTFILLLTTITFKFAVNQSLPKISYLTYMDKYILSSMALMCSVCVWHAIASSINMNDVDKYVLAGFCSLYVLAHATFFLYIYFAAIRHRREHVVKEREHAQKRQEAKVRSQQHQQILMFDNARRNPRNVHTNNISTSNTDLITTNI